MAGVHTAEQQASTPCCSAVVSNLPLPAAHLLAGMPCCDLDHLGLGDLS